MAPRFEPAQPLIPDISAAYGRAEATLRGNPVIADAVQDAARLQTQVAESRADRAFRGSQAALDRAQAAAGQSAAAMGRLGAQNVEAQQREFGRLDDRNNLVMQMQARAAQQQAETAARADLMRLESYIQSQTMNPRDVHELKQRQQLLSDVMADEELAPAEKRAIGIKLMSGARGIDLLEMRQQATQAKMLDQRAKEYQAQAELDTMVRTKNAELDAKTVEQRTVSIPLPDGGTATLYQTGWDQFGRPQYTQAKADKPAVDPAKLIEMDAGITTKIADLIGKQADMKAKAAAEGTSIDTSAIDQGIKDLQTLQQGVRQQFTGGRGGQQQGATLQGPPADDAGWTPTGNAGFDPQAPTGKAAEWVAELHRKNTALQNDPRYTQEQKAPIIQARMRRLQIAAKPNKTREDVEEYNRLGQVGIDAPAAPAEAPQPVRPVMSAASMSMRGGF